MSPARMMMWSCNDQTGSFIKGNLQHLSCLFQILCSVIHTRQNVTVHIYVSVHSKMTSIFLNYLLKKVAKRPITLILVYKYLRNLSINSTMILFLPFYICRIKSGSVIQTKHFDIKMSLEIRQAKSFFLTLFGYVFCIFSFFHLTYNYKLQLFVYKTF